MKRHTRAQVREQRGRWISKRIGQVRREWPVIAGMSYDGTHPRGAFSKTDPWDCGRTQCGLCRNGGYTRRYLREQAVVKCEMLDLMCG